MPHRVCVRFMITRALLQSRGMRKTLPPYGQLGEQSGLHNSGPKWPINSTFMCTLSQVATKTPPLLEVPSAGWVAAPPWGRGREHFPGGSLHRRVERPSTKGGQVPETPGMSSGDDNGQN